LESLDEDTLMVDLGHYLGSPETKSLMKKRDLAIQGLIDQRGEDSVLFEFKPVTKLPANRSG
jgi:hypothetical protein